MGVRGYTRPRLHTLGFQEKRSEPSGLRPETKRMVDRLHEGEKDPVPHLLLL